MLRLFTKLRDIDFGRLMALYTEGNRENAEQLYSDYDLNVGIMKAEQDFYQYLKEVFFTVPGAFYAVWEENGIYLCALRMEPYRSGLLLEALETHPDYRKRGYGKKLISQVLEQLKQTETLYVYAHVHKRNEASLRTHLSCGFTRILEHAVYIDGSVNSRCCTMEYCI